MGYEGFDRTVLRVVSSQRSNDCFFAALTRRVHLVPLGL